MPTLKGTVSLIGGRMTSSMYSDHRSTVSGIALERLVANSRVVRIAQALDVQRLHKINRLPPRLTQIPASSTVYGADQSRVNQQKSCMHIDQREFMMTRWFEIMILVGSTLSQNGALFTTQVKAFRASIEFISQRRQLRFTGDFVLYQFFACLATVCWALKTNGASYQHQHYVEPSPIRKIH
jgi:hypothetical protein